jgi:hypothetical protein
MIVLKSVTRSLSTVCVQSEYSSILLGYLPGTTGSSSPILDPNHQPLLKVNLPPLLENGGVY